MPGTVLPNLAAREVYIPHPEWMWHATALMKLASQKEKPLRTQGLVMKLMISGFAATELADFFENVGNDLEIAILGFDLFFAHTLQPGQPSLDILEKLGKVMNNIKTIHLWAYSAARTSIEPQLDELMAGLPEEAMRLAFMNEFKSYLDGFLQADPARFSDLENPKSFNSK